MKMKKNNFLVSIGLPVYNGEELLQKAIQSLLSQSYKNIELIISDNASTDNTEDICKKYALSDKRIRYFRQKKNNGASNNFNFVLNKARGHYFMWAAHDDYWYEDYIKELTTKLYKERSKKPVLVVTDYILYDNGKSRKVILNNKNILSRKEIIKDFLKNSARDTNIYIYGITITSLLKKLKGFHKDCRPFYHSSDYITILKILLSGRVVNVNKVLFFKRVRSYYFRKYDLLSSFNLNKTFFKLALRYLFDPVYNVLDLYYSIKYLVISDLLMMDKIELFFFFLFNYFKAFFIFIMTFIKSPVMLIYGMGKKCSKQLMIRYEKSKI